MTEEEKRLLIDFIIESKGDCSYKPKKEDIEETKQCLKEFDKIDTSQLIQEDLFCEIISRLYQEEFEQWTIASCWNRYIQGLNFLKKDNPEKKEILETYSRIIVPSDSEYYLTRDEVEDLLLKNGFQIDDRDKIDDIKEELVKLWKDKSKMLVPSVLEKDSKEWQGIPFKKLLFCEEYIKTGKVKTTCQNLGIGRTTAFEYLKDKEVQDYLQERKEEMRKESEEIFKQGINTSFEELLKIIQDTHKDDDTLNRKVRAIDTYLKHYENISKPKASEIE